MKKILALTALLALTLCGTMAIGADQNEPEDTKVYPKLKVVNEFDVGFQVNHARGAVVMIKGKRYLLVKYTSCPRMDPWHEVFAYPTDSYKIALLDLEENKIVWKKDLGMGIPTGDWFCPVLSFDIDKDGEDEIFFVDNNRPKFPLSADRSLVGLRARDGEEFMRVKVKIHVDTMSETYRFVLMGANVPNGDNLIVFQNGTYDHMDFSAYTQAGKRVWQRVIENDGTSRASHCSPVGDFLGNGSDQVLWGERMIDLRNGKDIFVCTEDGWDAHSDIVMPVFDRDMKFVGFWTCRESRPTPKFEHKQFRVNFYDKKGKIVWGKFRKGHMDRGGVFRRNAAGDKVFWCQEIPSSWLAKEVKFCHVKLYDMNGKELKFPGLPTKQPMRCVDINGDGVDEILYPSLGIWSLEGKKLFDFEGGRMLSGHFRNDLPGEQILQVGIGNTIRILADPNAKWSESAKKRYAHPYYQRCLQRGSVGYNFGYDQGGI